MRAVGRRNGISLDAQEVKVRAMAQVQDGTLVELIVDDQSAHDLKRPGMQPLLKLVDARKVDCVIVSKLDRLTRSIKDLAELLDRFQRRGVALVSVAESLDTGSAAGRLVINIMGAVSQWEREAIGERTREALAHLKASGKRCGNVPHGYALAADGKRLVENPQEQGVLGRIKALRAKGCSLRDTAARLNAEGLTTRCGGPWQHGVRAPGAARLILLRCCAQSTAGFSYSALPGWPSDSGGLPIDDIGPNPEL